MLKDVDSIAKFRTVRHASIIFEETFDVLPHMVKECVVVGCGWGVGVEVVGNGSQHWHTKMLD